MLPSTLSIPFTTPPMLFVSEFIRTAVSTLAATCVRIRQ